MRQAHDGSPALAIVSGVAGVLFGIIVGYILATGRAAPPSFAAAVQPAAPAPPATTPVTLVDEGELQAFRDILARDPKNSKAATELGNRLYDAGRYTEAIPYYQQAFALEPRNVDVSTDLGTALWYSGRPDEAIAQYGQSLAIQPDHPHTLFNLGIVRFEGKQDARGAIEAWERLLASTPGYAEADRVRGLLERARAAAPAPAAARDR